ncbi:MAG: hypothetical protein H6659_02360 [Ardenticatenaceae bacterium]|nr:hypothetical protein [Ardenticatenaceae bacterium]
MAAYEYEEDRAVQEFPALGVVSLWFGAALVLVTAVAQIMHGAKDTAAQSLQIILVAFILASGVYLVFRAGQGSLLSATVPLLINVGTLIIVQGVPFADLWESVRFQSNLTAYEQVIDLVEAGELLPDESGSTALPFGYRRLSANGRILIDSSGGVTRVFFYRRQAADGLAGYLYRADGAPPQAEFGGGWTVVLGKRPFWYYCARP